VNWQDILKMPAKDARYKVTQEDIKEMNRLKAEGKRHGEIWRIINKPHIDKIKAENPELDIKDIRGPFSKGIVTYWTSEESRKKQREKNAKRKYVAGSPEDIRRKKRDQQKRKRNWKADPDMKLRHEIQSAKDEKRADRKTVRGIDIKYAKNLLDSGKLQRNNKKVDE